MPKPIQFQRGVTTIEYALMGALVALGMVVGASTFGAGLRRLFDAVGRTFLAIIEATI